MTEGQKTVQITLTRSLIASCPKVRKTALALGLRRIGQTVHRPANDSVWGMIRAIRHLVTVKEE